MTMISSCRSPIFDGDGLSTEGSCMLKTTNVSWYMVVYHIVIVLYMSMGSHMTRANSINWGGYFVLVYLSVFWIDLKNQTEDYWYPSLTHQAFMHTSINTYEALRLDHDHSHVKYAQRHIHSKLKKKTKQKQQHTSESVCIASHFCLLPVRLSRHSLLGLNGLQTHLFSPNSSHLKSQSSATWISAVTHDLIQWGVLNMSTKKKNQFLSYLCTVNEICVQCSSFNGRENTQKNKKQNQKTIKEKKKSDFYWQGVLLVCFWFVCFWFLY